MSTTPTPEPQPLSEARSSEVLARVLTSEPESNSAPGPFSEASLNELREHFAAHDEDDWRGECCTYSAFDAGSLLATIDKLQAEKAEADARLAAALAVEERPRPTRLTWVDYADGYNEAIRDVRAAIEAARRATTEGEKA